MQDEEKTDVKFHLSAVQAAGIWATIVVPIITGLLWLSVSVQSLKDDIAHLTWRLDHTTASAALYQQPK